MHERTQSTNLPVHMYFISKSENEKQLKRIQTTEEMNIFRSYKQ